MTKKKSSVNHIEWTIGQVEVSRELLQSGHLTEARDAFLGAYLDGFELVESLLVVKDSNIKTSVERLFNSLRPLIVDQSISLDKKTRLYKELVEELRIAKSRLLQDNGKESGGVFTDFMSSMIIIVREGMEAFLVITSLLSLLVGLGARKARWFIHFGWVSAIVVGCFTYYVMLVLFEASGLAREMLEAVSTGVATILLLYTGFWIISSSESLKWSNMLRSKTKGALNNGQLWNLFFLSFTAVYRESVETVVFYSALYNQSLSQQALILGFLTGILVLLVLCSAVYKLQRKIPLHWFFRTTSVFMILVALVISGHFWQQLSAAGVVNLTNIN